MHWLVQEGAGPRPYDVSVSYLIELDPTGWLEWVGLGVVPLAPLAAVEHADLHDIVRQLDDRLGRELVDTRAEEFRTAVLLLLRLRYTPDQIIELVKEMVRLRESPAYEIIVEVGRAEGLQQGHLERARENLLKLGAAKLGPADTAVVDTVRAIDDLAMLEPLADRRPHGLDLGRAPEQPTRGFTPAERVASGVVIGRAAMRL